MNEFDTYARLAAINVGGAKDVLRLAAGGNRVTPVHFVSTASVVARRGSNPSVIKEGTRLTICEVGDTGYVQSKWVAEELMHAAAAKGLPVTIHRPGRVSGHSRTGFGSTSIGFWHFVRSMLLLQAAPSLRSNRTAPALPETVWFKLCGQCWRVQYGIVSFFCLGWRYVADGLQKAGGC